ncbi:MAG: sporulation protein YqfD, partial [Anaerotruncus colihominis]
FIYSGLEGDYKLERVTSQPKAGPIDLPFCVTRETYIFYELQKEQLGQQAALRLAQRQLEALERETWDQDAVKKRDVSASVENGELVLRGDYIVEMDIARQVEIPVTQYSQEKDEKKPARAGGY